MLDIYYGLNLWAGAALVIGVSTLISVGGHLGAHAILRRSVPKQETDLASSLMGVVAAFIGIMLAFSAVQAWSDYRQADKAVVEEASAISELYRDLAIYGEASRPARTAVRSYVDAVITDEWPRLAHGEAGPKAADALLQVFREVGRIQPETARERTIYAEVFTKLNEVVHHRRARMIAARSALPTLFWGVLLSGSLIILAYTFVYPSTRLNLLTIAGLAVSLGLIFMFILDVDRPFAGPYALKATELQGLGRVFDKVSAAVER